MKQLTKRQLRNIFKDKTETFNNRWGNRLIDIDKFLKIMSELKIVKPTAKELQEAQIKLENDIKKKEQKLNN